MMISDPARYAPEFIKAGADAITFHVEAVSNPAPVLAEIRRLGAAAGLAYNPHTPIASIEPFLAECEIVLTMSVEAGFGGQAFEPVALENLRHLKTLVSRDLLLEIDGGVSPDTIGACAEAGAQLFVVGSAIFKHPPYAQALAKLTDIARSKTRTSLLDGLTVSVELSRKKEPRA
jgi:ribulose-phosphate 3-epimerase